MANVKLTIEEPDETDEPLLPDLEQEDFDMPVEPEEPKSAKATKAAKEPATAKEPADEKSDQASSGRGLEAFLSKVAPSHEHALLGGLLGLAVAVLMFVAGFWRTLFVVLMVTIGVALGQYLDGKPKIINFIRRVIAEFRGN